MYLAWAHIGCKELVQNVKVNTISQRSKNELENLPFMEGLNLSIENNDNTTMPLDILNQSFAIFLAHRYFTWFIYFCWKGMYLTGNNLPCSILVRKDTEINEWKEVSFKRGWVT